MKFRNRGHFCNYCRKILQNKCGGFSRTAINPSIWYVWNHPEMMENFLNQLKKCAYDPSDPNGVNKFNTQLKIIAGIHKGLEGYGER